MKKIVTAIILAIFTSNIVVANEYTIAPFTAKKGKLFDNNNAVKNCKGTKKKYQINFTGNEISKFCQLPGSNYLETGTLPALPTDDYFGAQMTLCTKSVEQPKDLFVYGPWLDKKCPYDNPDLVDYVVNKENGYLDSLKNTFGDLVDAEDLVELEPFHFKSVTGAIPVEMEDTEFGEAEWNSYKKVLRNHARIITSYLNGNYSEASNKALKFLNEYSQNEAFSYFHYVPGSYHRNKSGKIYFDLTEPDFYDAAMSRLKMILPSTIILYSIVKKEHRNHPDFNKAEIYVEKLMWMFSETGVAAGRFGNRKGKLKWSIDELDHHTTWYSMLYTLWGVAKGDDKYFNAGLNTFIATLQFTRKDGSIISEVKKNPRPKSTHGGWGSLIRNNESVAFVSIASTIIHTQGYDVTKLNVKGKTILDIQKFAIEANVDQSVAKKHTGVKEHNLQHYNEPSSIFRKSLSWYNFAKNFYDVPKNEMFESHISKFDHNYKLEVLGLKNFAKN